MSVRRVLLCHGVRAARDLLWQELAKELTSAERTLDLRRPLRVLVSSRAQRQQLQADWVARARRPLVGLRVDTFGGAASEILRRLGDRSVPGDALFPVLVQRAVDADDGLAAELGSLRQRGSLAAASVADLLDAGLDEVSAEALVELLADQPLDARGAERTAALIRVALRIREQLGELGWTRPGDRLERAAHALDQLGQEVFPARSVWIYGAADATGRLFDFLEALTRAHRARIVVALPPDPERAGTCLNEYAEPFVTRFGGVVSSAPDAAALDSARVCGVEAAGADAEIRAVAERIRAYLDAGAAPESIGVVARQLEAYAIPIRTHFVRRGIPFSSLGSQAQGPSTPASVRARSVGSLLRHGADVSVDRWLDALGVDAALGSNSAREPRRNPLRHDLALGLHALGVGRLRALADLNLEERLGSRSRLRLPGMRSLRVSSADLAGASESEVGEVEAAEVDQGEIEPRELARETLIRAIAQASALADCFDAWQGSRAAHEHLERFQRLILDHLGWCERVPGFESLQLVVDRLSGLLPSGFPLDRSEFADLVEHELAECARESLGGQGGGVQVLDVMAARSLAWSHLFVIGVNRSVFPRAVSEDPLVPDRLRRAMAAVLPDLPIKSRGHLEEEHLFAELLGASEEVVLSCQVLSDEGEERAPSALWRRYARAHPDFEVERAVSPLARDIPDPHAGSFEFAVQSAVRAPVEEAREALRLALEFDRGEPRAEAPTLLGASELASARIAVVQALDLAPHRVRELGPYSGRLGSLSLEGASLPITTLENLARCPWQTFLRRVLRVQPPPDALDLLPGLEPRWVGVAVHSVLDRWAAQGLESPDRSQGKRHGSSAHLRWPEPDVLERHLFEACDQTLRDAGLVYPGLTRALVEVVRPRVEVARRLLMGDAQEAIEIVGSESVGSFELPRGANGPRRRIHYRADFAIRQGDTVRWIDFKTGAALTTAARAETRRRHLIQAIARGTHLQIAAYLCGEASSSASIEAAYLFLDPQLAPEHAICSIQAEDEVARACFSAVAAQLVDAFEAGAFFPRLLEPVRDQSPSACRVCEVSEACSQGDSGARLRLRSAMQHEQDPVVRNLWKLPLAVGPESPDV